RANMPPRMVGPKQADGVSILQGASRPTGASAADQGVRPTSSADFSLPTKTLRHWAGVPAPQTWRQHLARREQADGGVGRGPGGPPHQQRGLFVADKNFAALGRSACATYGRLTNLQIVELKFEFAGRLAARKEECPQIAAIGAEGGKRVRVLL